jgi:hypothetical protein
MKLFRVMGRIALLFLAAAVFIGLTQIYAGSVKPPPFANIYGQARRNNRPSAPQIGRLPSFFGEILLVALIAVAGRVVFRLRLTSASPNEDELTLLNLSPDQ